MTVHSSDATISGTAFITGAASGIGKVYAELLAARGFDLVLTARHDEGLDGISTDLQRRFGVEVEPLIVDLSQLEDLDRAVHRLAADTSIKVLVNSAALTITDALSLIPTKSMSEVVALNITALSALTMTVLPSFLKRNQGTIINVGAITGFAPLALTSIHGATKAYVQQFTQSLQLQVEGSEVRVQLVIPASVASESWDSMKIALSTVDPSTLMTAETFVNAALQGLENGESVTIPSLENIGLFTEYEVASMKLMAAAHTGHLAKRYLPRDQTGAVVS